MTEDGDAAQRLGQAPHLASHRVPGVGLVERDGLLPPGEDTRPVAVDGVHDQVAL